MSSFSYCSTLLTNWYLATMHQAADPNDTGWDLVKGWFEKDDDDDTQEMPLPEDYCKKCRGKMRELNTGFRKRMYACPKCDK